MISSDLRMTAGDKFDVQHAVDEGAAEVVDRVPASTAANERCSGGSHVGGECHARSRHRVEVQPQVEHLTCGFVRERQRDRAVPHAVVSRREVGGAVATPVDVLRRSVGGCRDQHFRQCDEVRASSHLVTPSISSCDRQRSS